ncbi:hypothetical protein [Corynebacterium freiburgense]|uniref:hypothetical protein n=1 Tax=Corynebacterium freiburgense TaxID=556548 RepID=UPI0003F95830|nr:hypothetical protein [Corynebacterium freiburgense]WJZ02312.1 hypothetical protein CFREI_05080 [Corynebacterium freiburgense]
MSTDQRVKIFFKSLLQEPDAAGFFVPSEHCWAEPIQADEGGGTFAMRTTGYGIPFTVDDIVRAQLNSEGELQVVSIERLTPGWVAWVALPPHSGDLRREALLELLGVGSFAAEGGEDMLRIAWGEEISRKELEARFRKYQDWMNGYMLLTVEQRAELLQEAVDLKLEMREPVQTDYWAADDPAWRGLGVDTPEFLARVQRMVYEDPAILATIRMNKQADVVAWLGPPQLDEFGNVIPLPQLVEPWPGLR